MFFSVCILVLDCRCEKPAQQGEKMSTLAPYFDIFNFPRNSSWESHLYNLQDEVTHEADGSCKLTIEVPGYSRENVSLATKGSQLVITLQRPEKNKKTLTYRLGSKVDISAISSSCKDGILTVLCPIKASEQPRNIPVD
jgi:HSP20 family molecular chaperone IbpA